MKNYFNLFRASGNLPPIVKGKIKGKLQNPFQETYFVRIDREFGFYGRLDECLVTSKGNLIPVDFKTSSSDPRQKEEILPAYDRQVDAYVFLLKKNRKKTSDYGYLIFVYPDDGKNLHNGFPMVIHVEKVKGNPDSAEKRIKEAIKILKEDIPTPSLECPFCKWHDKVSGHIH